MAGKAPRQETTKQQSKAQYGHEIVDAICLATAAVMFLMHDVFANGKMRTVHTPNTDTPALVIVRTRHHADRLFACQHGGERERSTRGMWNTPSTASGSGRSADIMSTGAAEVAIRALSALRPAAMGQCIGPGPYLPALSPLVIMHLQHIILWFTPPHTHLLSSPLPPARHAPAGCCRWCMKTSQGYSKLAPEMGGTHPSIEAKSSLELSRKQQGGLAMAMPHVLDQGHTVSGQLTLYVTNLGHHVAWVALPSGTTSTTGTSRLAATWVKWQA